MKKLIVIAIAGIMVLLTGAGTASGRNRVSRTVRLAGHGDPAAQLDYARLLKTTGNGVTQDWDKAVEMLQKASDNGNQDALKAI